MLILVISYVVVCYNKENLNELVDGIVVILLYNLFEDGGFKYNLLNGGFVDIDVIKWIEDRVN